jgi:hypothetical protein
MTGCYRRKGIGFVSLGRFLGEGAITKDFLNKLIILPLCFCWSCRFANYYRSYFRCNTGVIAAEKIL